MLKKIYVKNKALLGLHLKKKSFQFFTLGLTTPLINNLPFPNS